MGHYPCPECCGGSPCAIHADTFDRGDSTTIPNTTELVGNWANTSNALHPDHAASDQRLRFDLATVDAAIYGFVQRVTIRGQTGDRIGLGVLLDADGNSFAGATVTFGAGTNGRIDMNGFADGALDWTWDEALECAVNEYNIPDETPTSIELCTIVGNAQPGGAVRRTYHFTVTAASVTHRVGYAAYSSGESSPFNIYGATLTGADAVTSYFDNYEAERASFLAGPCPICPTCDYGTFSVAYAEEISGFWANITGGDTGVHTDDTNAIILWDANLAWANDNMCWWWEVSPFDYTSSDHVTPRFIFSWVDDENYWFVEFDIDYYSSSGWMGVTWRIVEVVAAVETEHLASTGYIPLVYYFWVRICVWDCVVALGFNFGSGFSWYCLDTLDINNTGRWGLGTGATTSTTTYFRKSLTHCATEFDCEDFPTFDQPDPPEPPDEPFESCCPDIGTIAVDDTFEFQINSFDIDSGAECLADPCADDIFLVFLGLADIFTLTCVYASAVHAILYGDTGVVNPCSGSDESAKIWVWITKTGESTCTIRIALFVATCHAFWETEITDEDACLDVDVPFVGYSGDYNCCINFAGSTARISLP